MIDINNLSLTHIDDNRLILDHFSFYLNKKDKVAIIGEEGNGKSTLLKAIHDINLIENYINVKGSIVKLNCKTAYLPQELTFEEREISCIAYFGSLENFYEINPKRINEIAKQLQIDDDLFYSDRLLKSFSGGELVKLQLAKLLLSGADVLLLDEPSNNLDLPTLEYLEYFIMHTDLAVIFISHDETLINNCANIIIHFEQIKRKTISRYTIYKGNYNEYIDDRTKAFKMQDKNAAKQRSEFAKKEERYRRIYNRVHHELNTISRQDPHGGQLLKKKMKSTISLGKRLDKEKDNLMDFHEEEGSIMINFDDVYIPTNKIIIKLDLDNLIIKNKILASNLHLEIYGPKKIAIIARNGVGKSTLLRYIYNSYQNNLKLAYMPQNYQDLMDFNITPIEFIKKDSNKLEYSQIRTLLGSIKFKDDEMLHQIKDLSGGQKAKLFFIKMIYHKAEVLLLDEPTRNFSPLSSSVIRKILKDYKGVIIMVTHDRLLLSEVPDEIYELFKDGLKLIDII